MYTPDMWDEEGLEPIGNVHPVGSYESSEMNSIVRMNLYILWQHFVYLTMERLLILLGFFYVYK